MPTTTPFNNLITFSRGSNATVTGSNGLIQWAPNNLVTFSEQFDNAAWIAFSATASANVTLAPDGTRTADKIAEVAGGAGQSRYATATAPFATITASCYVKASERTFSRIAVSGSGSAQWFGATFDVQNGVVTQQNAGASGTISGATITAVGDGWYRCTVTGLTGATSGNTFTYIGPSDSGTPTAGSFGVAAYTGTAGSGVLVWGAQLELGSTATTYNSTTVKNLLSFSEAFDNAAWTKTNNSIVTGAQANPVNGLFNAQKLMENTAAGTHEIRQDVTTLAAPYTFSVYIKAAERTFAMLYHGQTNAGQVINLSTGALAGNAGLSAPTNANVTAIGSGWYRISITVTATAASNNFRIYPMGSASVFNYTGDGNSGVYIYGAQLSDSASLDPYVPTPGAAPSSTAFYGPRFDFDPVTLQPRGLLVEEQRTNLVLRSEELDNAGSWTATDATVSANTATSPSGAMTADKLSETATTARHFLSTVAAVIPSAATYNVSVYAKAAERSRFNIIASGGTPDWAWFDLSAVTATVGSGTGAATITAVGNGWYRCTFTIVATAAGAVQFNLMDNVVLPARLPSYAGIAGSGLLLWGAQAEAGAFATSYIPTVASTVTRSADVATITGQNFAQWFGQAEGAFTFSGDSAYGSGGFIGSTPTTGAILYANTNASRTFNGTNFIGTANTYTNNAVFNTALGYSTAGRSIVLNGGTVATDANLIQTPTAVTLGGAFGGGYLNGHIRSIRFIPARAADFQLQGLSS